MDTILHLIFWAPLLAERQYYPQLNSSTWDQARDHCQVCYKELVSLTPDNAYHLTQNLTSDYWVGLRKNLNGSVAWSRWSNGDPLCFQNWYLGRPVLAKPKDPVVNIFNTVYNNYSCPNCECCDCGCTEGTTPGTTTATEDYDNYTLDFNQTFDSTTMEPMTTGMTTGMTTVMTTMALETNGTTLPRVANSFSVTNATNGTSTEEEEEEGGYLEDPCVSMLSFGPWFEKKCSELLPYICYEDRFYGDAKMTNVDLHSGTLSWLAGPGDISNYRVEVKGVLNQTLNHTELTLNLSELTAGTLYTVQVFAIKCMRELNPQNVSFYTRPDVPTNLAVTMVKETSIFLSWNPPIGNRSFYYIRVSPEVTSTDIPPCTESGEVGGPVAGGSYISSCTERGQVDGLMPGGFYMFEVSAGVKDKSMEGDRVNVTRYTKPGKVSELREFNVKDNSVDVEWEPPLGNTSGYRVDLSWNNYYDIETNRSRLSLNVNETRSTVTPLPAGTVMNLSVVALVPGGSVEGDPVTITILTTPGAVIDLKLIPTANSISVTWKPPEGNYESFDITLASQHDKTIQQEIRNSSRNFTDLKAAAEYTVTVWTLVSHVNGHLRSEPVSCTNFTLPVKPEAVRVLSYNKTGMSIQWDPPKASKGVPLTYSISYHSFFWNEGTSVKVYDSTTYTFGSLRPGTRYQFSVSTVAGDLQSNSVSTEKQTDPEETILTLFMECSSSESLFCEKGTTRTNVLKKLKKHFDQELSDNVFWELEWRKE